MKTSRGQKRRSLITVGAAVVILAWPGLSASYSPGGRAGARILSTPFAAEESRPGRQESGANSELAGRLRALCDRAGGDVGVAVIHVETGQSVSVEGAKRLPLFSVFKLPLAVAVLKDVEENRLRLDQKVRVTPAEAAPGSQANSDLWRKPSERTVAELLELSVSRSDNTSSDKLLQLVGGPEAVTRRMRALNLQNIDIRYPVREFAAKGGKPNTGTASDLAQLLALMKKGEVLQPPQLTVLIGFMERATTGLRRLRGDLPAGTPVADKTGTGEAGAVTNDVGIITLPGGRGHLAMAVLISGSKLPARAQEKLIAELALAAYEAHLSRATRGTHGQSQDRL